MEQMTITKALSELSLLDKRIEKAIDKANFIDIAKNKSNKVNPSMTKADFEANAKASMQSIKALMERRDALKSLVVQSNATTIVEICGKQMSVAMAIETKNSIAYREELLEHLKKCYKVAEAQKANKEASNKEEVDKLILMIYGTDKVSEEEYNNTSKNYFASHPIVTVDPLQLEDKIKAEDEFISEFKSNINDVLVISNCTTKINL